MRKTDLVTKTWTNALLYIVAGGILFQANLVKLTAATFVKADNTTDLDLAAIRTDPLAHDVGHLLEPERADEDL